MSIIKNYLWLVSTAPLSCACQSKVQPKETTYFICARHPSRNVVVIKKFVFIILRNLFLSTVFDLIKIYRLLLFHLLIPYVMCVLPDTRLPDRHQLSKRTAKIQTDLGNSIAVEHDDPNVCVSIIITSFFSRGLPLPVSLLASPHRITGWPA